MNPIAATLQASAWQLGPAEIAGIITAFGTVLAAITTLIVQLRRMRAENTTQHAEGREITTDIRDRLLNLHETIDHIDEKVDDVAENLQTHEKTYHRPRRW
jgi:small-conductance mechanosensitive channel